MALTTFDPKTALVIIDLQNGIVAMPVAPPVGPVIEKAAALAAAFRLHDLPVVLVNVTGGAPGRSDTPAVRGPFPPGFADMVPQLDQQPSDLLVTKQTWGAFAGTDLQSQLKAQGVTQIVLLGVATSIGVESTAREAHALGFNISLIIDAMTDRVPEAHANSIERIFPRLGECGDTADALALLERTFG